MKTLNKKSQNDESNKKNRANVNPKELSDELLNDEVGSYGMDDEIANPNDLPPCFLNKPPMELDEDPDVIEDQVRRKITEALQKLTKNQSLMISTILIELPQTRKKNSKLKKRLEFRRLIKTWKIFRKKIRGQVRM